MAGLTPERDHERRMRLNAVARHYRVLVANYSTRPTTSTPRSLMSLTAFELACTFRLSMIPPVY